MTRYIKYSELADEIKEIVQEYYQSLKTDNTELNYEEAMLQWFEKMFEDWIVHRFSIKPKGDRRKNERREADRENYKDKNNELKKQSKKIDNEPAEEANRRKASRRWKNRRKYNRFEIEIPVKIVEALNDRDDEKKGKKDKIYKTKNISRGGLYFRSMEPFNISSRIKVIIDFSKVDNELESIEAEAMIVRVEKLENGDYGNSIIFENIPDVEHRKCIDLFVFKNLVYQQNHLYRFY